MGKVPFDRAHVRHRLDDAVLDRKGFDQALRGPAHAAIGFGEAFKRIAGFLPGLGGSGHYIR